MSQFRSLLYLRLLGCLCLCLWGAASFAGGYLLVTTGGAPYKWNSNAITLSLDQGVFSATKTNAQGVTLVSNAVNRWASSQVAECALSFTVNANALSTDNANGNASAPSYSNGFCDGINPVIFDAQGYLTDAALGAGANQGVLGFAGPYCTSAGAGLIVKGQIVLNGLFLDGAASPNDVSDAQYEGVVTHEVGHMLNLDHSQIQRAETVMAPSTHAIDYTGLPTMYPNVHADIQDLELDDKAWISNLYPSGTGNQRTKITGTVSLSGNSLSGINVVARSVSDSKQCISCVSGFIDPTTPDDNSVNEGFFTIPMLGTNTQWILDIEPLGDWTGGSGVGPLDPVYNLTAPPEFFNETSAETAFDNITASTTFVTPVTPGATLSGVNLNLNNTWPTSSSSEGTDPGSALGSPLIVNLSAGEHTISANMTAETGSLSFGGDDIEDIYALTGPAGMEITEVTMAPTGFDGRIMLVNYDHSGGAASLIAQGNSGGTGVSETIKGQYDFKRFGTGTGANRIYLFVTDNTAAPASGIGTYTFKIKCVPSNDEAVAVNKPANIDPNLTSIALTGRGFKNSGGDPAVTFSNSGLQVNSVTYNTDKKITVNYSKLGSFVPGSSTDITVTNHAGSGGFSGKVTGVTTNITEVSNWDIY